MTIVSGSQRPNPDVVVIGESLIDMISTAAGPVEFVGGSGLDVAFGLGRLGANTGLLTIFGADQRGEAIRQHLASADVQLLPGAVRLDRTSTAMASLDNSGSARYTFDIEWTLPPATPTFVPKVLHTGSLATFLEPGAAHVRALLQFFSGRCLITYDPNIRPDVVGNQPQAQETFEETARFATLVKLSDEDAGWLYPGLPTPEIAARILGLGVEVVAVTAGAEGSDLYSNSAHVHIAAPQVDVADTVGAGDSYMSSLIASLLMNPGLEFGQVHLESLGRAAAAAAAITVTRHGANPPTAVELEEVLAVSRSNPTAPALR
jgi:fructokinase